MEDSSAKPSWSWREILSHFGIIIVLFPTIISCLRILALSRGDLELIPTIVANVDLKTIVFASIVPLMTIVMAPALAFAIGYLWITSTRRWWAFACTFLAIPLLALTNLAGMAWPFTFLLWGISYGIKRVGPTRSKWYAAGLSTWNDWYIRSVVLLFGGVLLLVFLFGSS